MLRPARCRLHRRLSGFAVATRSLGEIRHEGNDSGSGRRNPPTLDRPGWHPSLPRAYSGVRPVSPRDPANEGRGVIRSGPITSRLLFRCWCLEEDFEKSGGIDDDHRRSRSARTALMGETRVRTDSRLSKRRRRSLTVGRSAICVTSWRRYSESESPSIAARAFSFR